MPKKKKLVKPVTEMTNDELAASVFPKKVHQHLKKLANPDPVKSPRK